eukprot:COSAG05_NODE_13407_length_431_cov_2.834337_1_plen_57_part_00
METGTESKDRVVRNVLVKYYTCFHFTKFIASQILAMDGCIANTRASKQNVRAPGFQ